MSEIRTGSMTAGPRVRRRLNTADTAQAAIAEALGLDEGATVGDCVEAIEALQAAAEGAQKPKPKQPAKSPPADTAELKMAATLAENRQIAAAHGLASDRLARLTLALSPKELRTCAERGIAPARMAAMKWELSGKPATK